VTDPGVGLATSYGPPLGWYDPSNGEIGDICNAQQGTFLAGTVTYTVQKEWSNLSGACIGVTGSDAFAVNLSPSSQDLTAGSSVNYTVSAPVLRGSAQSVALSVSGLPSGVAGSFSPSTITTGATSTLTLSAGSSAVNGAANFTVSGAGSVSNASGGAQVNVSGGKTNCPPGTHDSGGVCVPDGGGGCSTQTAGALGFAALSLALLFARRRSRA
jgi:MYXO-CTERM domain-containing protein